MPTRYVLMTFGEEDFRYWQAHYCLLTLMAHAPRPCELVMATDHPERFAWFGDTVRIHHVDRDELSRWLGPQRYFLRALIQTLRLGALLSPAAEVAIYMDTDTAAQASLQPILDAVAEGRIAMDRREYILSTHSTKGSRRLWRAVGNRAWAGVKVLPATEMWNTGITALGSRDFALADQALAATDAMLDSGCDHYLTEQIAMSAALSADGRAVEINPSGREPLVCHYWGNKDGWNEAICQTLATIHLRSLGVADAAAHVAANPIHRPQVVKRRWWHRALHVEPVRR